MASITIAQIERILQEHETIKQEINQFKNRAQMQVVFVVTNKANWTESAREEFEKMQFNIHQMVANLHDGFMRHFTFEEENLGSYTDYVLMEELVSDHQLLTSTLTMAKEKIDQYRLIPHLPEALEKWSMSVKEFSTEACDQLEKHERKEQSFLVRLKDDIQAHLRERQ